MKNENSFHDLSKAAIRVNEKQQQAKKKTRQRRRRSSIITLNMDDMHTNPHHRQTRSMNQDHKHSAHSIMFEPNHAYNNRNDDFTFRRRYQFTRGDEQHFQSITSFKELANNMESISKKAYKRGRPRESTYPLNLHKGVMKLIVFDINDPPLDTHFFEESDRSFINEFIESFDMKNYSSAQGFTHAKISKELMPWWKTMINYGSDSTLDYLITLCREWLPADVCEQREALLTTRAFTRKETLQQLIFTGPCSFCKQWLSGR